MTTPIDAAAELPEPVTLSEADRRRLLDLARTAVAVAARALPPEALHQATREAGDPHRSAAAFVTLTRGGTLRGCMGILDPTRPVVESVIEAAACATRTDPRFPTVQSSELASLELEVSILGPLTRISDPLTFRLGIDGIVVERHGRRGLLLPEVAPMVNDDRVEMLEIACRKAGLPSGAWGEPDTAVYAFCTDRFGGPAVGHGEPEAHDATDEEVSPGHA